MGQPRRLHCRSLARMFKNTFQSGFLSILYSIGSKPLQIWEKEVRNGHIKRITYSDIRSSVLEIMSELCVGDHVDQHIDDVRHLPLRREQNARDQAPVSRHDNQEFEKVFYLRGSGA